ncbi:MAG: hypothetical protein RLZZ511_4158 [Cyanobacteriota bacterium]|jgi:hypothetical protein
MTVGAEVKPEATVDADRVVDVKAVEVDASTLTALAVVALLLPLLIVGFFR